MPCARRGDDAGVEQVLLHHRDAVSPAAARSESAAAARELCARRRLVAALIGVPDRAGTRRSCRSRASCRPRRAPVPRAGSCRSGRRTASASSPASCAQPRDLGRRRRRFDFHQPHLLELAAHAREQIGAHRHLRHQRRVLHHDRDAAPPSRSPRSNGRCLRRPASCSTAAAPSARRRRPTSASRLSATATSVPVWPLLDDERHGAGDLFEDHPQQQPPFLFGQRVAFAGVAEQAEAVRAALDQEADEAALALEIERAVVMERRVDDRERCRRMQSSRT